MGEIFEPLDPVDAQALAEETISPDDARAVHVPDPETGQDSERLVVLENRRAGETEQELDPGENLDLEDDTDPAHQ
ncbi:hypothetical protein [Paeniglutamicibacter psychrophenolicus]|uniref:hypothetical protein n=1 Tax=Paeniglutamicibacter psychrophenolicus TaxID=257454 RepID=UPI00278387D9|nr:hypothetical protein [Paeniglutamicibacter psychrophenolicus]MDQ0092772.1 hypothetical protein [Paeniglutamicibacter psychrophenolicus]